MSFNYSDSEGDHNYLSNCDLEQDRREYRALRKMLKKVDIGYDQALSIVRYLIKEHNINEVKL